MKCSICTKEATNNLYGRPLCDEHTAITASSLRELEVEQKRLIKEFSDSIGNELEQKRLLLNNELRSLIGVYSDSIRNVSVISGVVAPFSLTLLGVVSLNLNVGFLLLGFAILIANIAISQLLLNVQIDLRHAKLGRAELDWISALLSKDIIQGKRTNDSEKVTHMSEYVLSNQKLDKALGLNLMDIEITQTGLKLRRYNRLMNGLFFVGCSCIIASIFLNYPIELVVNLLTRWHWF